MWICDHATLWWRPETRCNSTAPSRVSRATSPRTWSTSGHCDPPSWAASVLTSSTDWRHSWAIPACIATRTLVTCGVTWASTKNTPRCNFTLQVPYADLLAMAYHLLRGSGSTEFITATGFVYGNADFRPLSPRNRPLNRSPRNLLQVITSATPTPMPNLVQIRSQWAACGHIDEIQHFLKNTCFGDRPTGQTAWDRFSRVMAQTTRTHAKVCLSRGFVDIPPPYRAKKIFGREQAFSSQTR